MSKARSCSECGRLFTRESINNARCMPCRRVYQNARYAKGKAASMSFSDEEVIVLHSMLEALERGTRPGAEVVRGGPFKSLAGKFMRARARLKEKLYDK